MSAAVSNLSKFQTLSKNRCFLRTVSTSQLKLTEDKAEEIKIPVPWGHIAGKWWGHKVSPPVLAIHGWQDNAGSFDKLIPLLNTSSVLAIDLPGHGHSSHLPDPSAYDFAGFLILLQRIKKHFNWTQMGLLTHSYGGALGYVYSSLFPNEIRWHVNLECARGLLTSCRGDLPDIMSKGIDELIKIGKQKKEKFPQAYKLSHMIKMCIEGSFGSITSSEAALLLLKRGICLADDTPASKKIEYNFSGSDLADFIKYEKQGAMLLPEEEKACIIRRYLKMMEALEKLKNEFKEFHLKEGDDKYHVYTRDPCIKVLVFQTFSEEFIIEVSKNIICPILSIRANDGFLYGCTRRLYEKTLDILRTNSVSLEHHDVDGKWWGSNSRRPVLCVHGWQDNANTFKTLIPQLSSEFSYLAIDLPGHGLSSHLPKGVFYNVHTVLDTIRRVQFYFKWTKVSLIGHSYGAGCSFLFASCFTNTVDFFVGIDAIKLMSRDCAKDIKNAPKTIEKMLVQDSLSVLNTPLYSKDNLIQRWIKATNNSLTKNSCQILMERGAKVSSNLFQLTRDGRLKFNFSTNFTQEEYLKMAESITCSVLYVKAKDGPYFEKRENILQVLNVLQRTTKLFQNHELPGTHHFHLNTPEIIAPVINSFIMSATNYH